MKLLKPIVSSMIALLVLVSSSSFIVNMHFCGGQVQSFSLIEEAASCPMEVQLPPCHKKMAVKKSGCCEDKHVAFEGKDFNTQIQDFSMLTWQSINWVATLPMIMEVIQVNESLVFSNHTPYKPPIVERDIPVLVQSFLI
ncbi:MAG TPA: hypothetical protein PLJ13_19450 [Cyclobacteriaceae bacterium]|nr:hypothetical protein [Cyclobacteriaceae bacterium]